MPAGAEPGRCEIGAKASAATLAPTREAGTPARRGIVVGPILLRLATLVVGPEPPGLDAVAGEIAWRDWSGAPGRGYFGRVSSRSAWAMARSAWAFWASTRSRAA